MTTLDDWKISIKIWYRCRDSKTKIACPLHIWIRRNWEFYHKIAIISGYRSRRNFKILGKINNMYDKLRLKLFPSNVSQFPTKQYLLNRASKHENSNGFSQFKGVWTTFNKTIFWLDPRFLSYKPSKGGKNSLKLPNPAWEK